MQAWLNNSDVRERLGLPESFEVDTLEPYVTDVVEEWLGDLLVKPKYQSLLAWLILNPNGVVSEQSVSDTYNEGLYPLVSRFIIYAAYADYIQRGEFIPTESGLVKKDRDNSEGLDPEERAMLARVYKDKATRRAKAITDYVTVSSVCASPGGGNNARISKARGRTESRF